MFQKSKGNKVEIMDDDLSLRSPNASGMDERKLCSLHRVDWCTHAMTSPDFASFAVNQLTSRALKDAFDDMTTNS